MSRFIKDPDAVLDYQWDWSAWLASGETITAAEIIADTGITVVDDSKTDTTVTARLSGGTLDELYKVTCRITTNQSRVDDRTITIRVKHR